MATSALQFTVKNWEKLDKGRIASAINHAVRQAISDCSDRPGNDAARKIVIEITAKPKLDKTSAALDTVDVSFDIKCRLPAATSAVYPMVAAVGGVPMFQELSPFDPRQESLFKPQLPPGTEVHINGERIDPDTGEVLPKNQ